MMAGPDEPARARHRMTPHRGPLTIGRWPGVSGDDGLAARLAHQPGLERVTAAVRKDRRGAVPACQVAVAPCRRARRAHLSPGRPERGRTGPGMILLQTCN